MSDNRSCRICGCTDDDCRQCVAKIGSPCRWVGEDLCSACAPRQITSLKRLPADEQRFLLERLVELMGKLAQVYELVRDDIPEIEEATQRMAFDLIVNSPPPAPGDFDQLKSFIDEHVIAEGMNFFQQLRYDLAVADAPFELFQWACVDLPPQHPAWQLRRTGFEREGNEYEVTVPATEDSPHVD